MTLLILYQLGLTYFEARRHELDNRILKRSQYQISEVLSAYKGLLKQNIHQVLNM